MTFALVKATSVSILNVSIIVEQFL